MAKRLRWKEYDYTVQVGPGNSWVYRPLITVEISSKISGESIPIKAMIDSGTDGTVLNADVARSLFIDPEKCQKVKLGGIGVTEGFTCNIKLTIPDFKVTMDIPVVFAEKPPFDGLLGQKHFFQRFRIRFEKDRNKFHLASV